MGELCYLLCMTLESNFVIRNKFLTALNIFIPTNTYTVLQSIIVCWLSWHYNPLALFSTTP